MNEDDVTGFLSRWSRRKLGKEESPAAPQATEVPAAAEPPAGEAPAPEPLPAVESLTPDSDFKPFMRPDVDPGVKQAALKQMFKDPHFNVMDGLDTYIDDYSIEDPIPEAMMKNLYQAREHLFSDEEKAAADAADAEAKADAEAVAAIEASLPAPEPFPAEPPHLYAPDQKA